MQTQTVAMQARGNSKRFLDKILGWVGVVVEGEVGGEVPRTRRLQWLASPPFPLPLNLNHQMLRSHPEDRVIHGVPRMFSGDLLCWFLDVHTCVVGGYSKFQFGFTQYGLLFLQCRCIEVWYQ
jgi:hypothetical protein